MLHAGRQGDHGQVVGIGDGIDVTSEPEREWSKGDALRQAAAGGRALDVERGTATGLADAACYTFSKTAEPLDEAHRSCRLAFPQRGWCDRRHIDILAGRAVLEAFQYTHVVNFAKLPTHWNQLIFHQACFICKLLQWFHGRFGGFRNLPVFQFGRVEFHCYALWY